MSGAHGGPAGSIPDSAGIQAQVTLQQRLVKEPGQTLPAQPGLAGFDLGRGAQVRAQLVQCNERIPVGGSTSCR
jgi:hypothetical protein